MPENSASNLVAEPKSVPKIRAPKRPAGTLYRGNVGMWSWVLHRITGVALYFFLLVHILDTALVRVSPEAYNIVIESYKTPLMGIGEIVLVAAIGFHAINGLRIILIDFWAFGAKHHVTMFWVVVSIWLVLLIGFVPRHLMHVFGG
ncbi:succinate dehydrogenase subunit C [Rhodoglobus vestalii]|uniref:Succinate dehydrogenase subunit C n=1 Tax=Rhodoglobus vestalii TaxID=193384 RepID=A0A8H2K562_9MICO|nr:succinate dehydrogenase, cytochrome b556 subunit [Rhodoglobus vestalii]TQO19370.1 succinate dehydrogenase subunit C [Rhodoglobus vestalii]